MKYAGAFEDCARVIENREATKPDVVLMDIDMPHVNGIEGVRNIRKQLTDLLIVMQTVFEDNDKIFDSIKAGANGYILKKASPEKIIEDIHDVVNGGAPIMASNAKKVLTHFQKEPTDNKDDNPFQLSIREKEILTMLVKGLSYKMIGDACVISTHTVNNHLKKIYSKLHVHSATEAVSMAIKEVVVE